MSWDKASDFEVNKAVAKVEGADWSGITEQNKGMYNGLKNYCNSWADMGPVIFGSGISIIKWPDENDGYEASVVSYYGHGSIYFDIFYWHQNPLRAAAIVYLEMNGVEYVA